MSIINKIVTNKIGYPLQDFVNKTEILKTKKFLLKSQYWDDEQIHQYRLDKLNKLLHHAYNNVPYYQKLFNDLKLKPSDIQSFNDLKKLPILTKDIARRENENLISKNIGKYDIKKKTGGTTGPPLTRYVTANSKTFSWGAYYRWYSWMGIEQGDPVVTFWGAPTVLSESKLSVIKRKAIDLLTNDMRINTFNMNKNTFPEITKKIINQSPRLIRGYLSGILDFAYYLNDNNINNIRPKAISTTTETLLPPYRKYLEETFNCPVFDQYGCGEINSIAFECSAHNGLHINMEHVFVEVLDEYDNSVDYEKVGRLIATDLDNYTMPFIRYENGDKTSLKKDKCTCNINQPLLNRIDGRVVDTISLADGSKVHPVFFTDVVYELESTETKNMRRFQVYQEVEGSIEFRIEEYSQLSEKYLDLLKENLETFFNNVTLKIMKELEYDKSGKFRYVIRNIKK